jgi:hypothetical protein
MRMLPDAESTQTTCAYFALTAVRGVRLGRGQESGSSAGAGSACSTVSWLNLLRVAAARIN